MEKSNQVERTTRYVKEYFENEGSGHDWWHLFRVNKLALQLAKKEGGDMFIIEMAALLHDLDDWKLFGKDNQKVSKTSEWLQNLGLKPDIIQKIEEIIGQVSFKGANVEVKATGIEAQIVQDADRLDAIGAIGIARTFAYGGSKGRLLYHPKIEPVMHNSFDTYRNNNAPTINHFYEKLLLLKDRMNTSTAKEMAKKRHQFMELYLENFYQEWDANI